MWECVGVVVVIPVSVSSLMLLASSRDMGNPVAKSLRFFNVTRPGLVWGLVRSKRTSYGLSVAITKCPGSLFTSFANQGRHF